MLERAERLKKVPPYLFAEIGRRVRELRSQGVDVISLGIGDPDRPTPDPILRELLRAVQDPQDAARHRYGGDNPVFAFNEAVAEWYQKRFGVELDPATEVLQLMGSKDGIAHLPLAFINPGDVTLAPDPGYTVYRAGTLFAGGTVYSLPLLAERGFLPDLEAIPQEVSRRAKLLWLNYPNNPTTAVADLAFFRRAVEFARQHGLLLCHDIAYGEITFDGYRAPSILQVEGAKEVAIEIGSLSKPYNMTGWRIGYAVGNAEALAALAAVKENMDSGILRAIQFAAVAALRGPQECVEQMKTLYRRRRDLVVETLNRLGWRLEKPKGTFYVWAPVPEGYDGSISFASALLERAAVVVTPGVGYGEYGEGYFRISLTLPDDLLQEAMARLERALTL